MFDFCFLEGAILQYAKKKKRKEKKRLDPKCEKKRGQSRRKLYLWHDPAGSLVLTTGVFTLVA